MSTSGANEQASLEGRKLIFSGTTAHRGRAISVSPANSTLDYLHYGRILLGPDVPRVAFSTEGRETALLVMRGARTVPVDGAPHALGLHDAIYVPKGCAIEVSTTVDTDVCECA